jgi:hypothetical protein
MVRDAHKHEIPENNDGVDRVQAYTADTEGDDIDAGQDSNQYTDTVGGSSTTNINELDADDIILNTQNTDASQLTVKVNGTEVSGSPFSLSGKPSHKKEDISITSEATTPGFNTVELIPDDKALVKGNVVVDHKIEGERS